MGKIPHINTAHVQEVDHEEKNHVSAVNFDLRCFPLFLQQKYCRKKEQ